MKYRFNKHGVCTNPIIEVIWNTHPYFFEIALAGTDSNWAYGYQMAIKGQTDGCGICGQGVWDINLNEGKGKEQCIKEALLQGLEYFSESQRIDKAKKIISHINKLIQTLEEAEQIKIALELK